jgi:hypothetical protein
MKKLVGKGSVHVIIGDESGKTTLDMYLNPATSIESLKRELVDREIMTEDEIIEIGDRTPGDDQRVSDLDLEDGCTITIRGKDGK